MAENELLDNPYQTITEYAEELYPNTGMKVFRYLALQPCSLVLPPMPYKNRLERNTIHTLILSKSGMAKSSISQILQEISPHPIFFKKYTPAYLRDELFKYENQQVSLITDDVSRIMSDGDMLKLLEGIMEEQKVSEGTVTGGQKKFDIYATVTLMGVYSDLTSKIQSGILSRMTPVVFTHGIGEQLDVGRYIGENIAKIGNTNGEFESIKKHYQTIYEIQKKDTKDRIMPRIISCSYTSDQRNKLINTWGKIVREMCSTSEETEVWYRELIDAFRFANSSALLNIKNRKLKKISEDEAEIEVHDNDVKLAINLVGQEIKTKYLIIHYEGYREKLVPFGKISRILDNGLESPQELMDKLNNYKETHKELFKNEPEPNLPRKQLPKGRPSPE